MNQQEERNCVAVSCSSCFLKLSMLQKQTEKIENMLFCIKKTLNFKEACLYMGLSRSQLYKLAKNGHIPHYTPGRISTCVCVHCAAVRNIIGRDLYMVQKDQMVLKIRVGYRHQYFNTFADTVLYLGIVIPIEAPI